MKRNKLARCLNDTACRNRCLWEATKAKTYTTIIRLKTEWMAEIKKKVSKNKTL